MEVDALIQFGFAGIALGMMYRVYDNMRKDRKEEIKAFNATLVLFTNSISEFKEVILQCKK
jgi:hypothetical protein